VLQKKVKANLHRDEKIIPAQVIPQNRGNQPRLAAGKRNDRELEKGRNIEPLLGLQLEGNTRKTKGLP